MKNSFHNSTGETGQLLLVFESKASKQEDKVLEILQQRKAATPSEIWESHFKKHLVPITSVRRALTNLYNEGKAEKTNMKKMGMFGRPESIYEIA